MADKINILFNEHFARIQRNHWRCAIKDGSEPSFELAHRLSTNCRNDKTNETYFNLKSLQFHFVWTICNLFEKFSDSISFGYFFSDYNKSKDRNLASMNLIINFFYENE